MEDKTSTATLAGDAVDRERLVGRGEKTPLRNPLYSLGNGSHCFCHLGSERESNYIYALGGFEMCINAINPRRELIGWTSGL